MNRTRYLPRVLAPVLEQALRDHPVVILTGARQTGKTTLVQNLDSAAGRTFESLDDLDTLELARKRPDELLARGRRVTLDEVQRAPEVLLAVKRDIDRDRRRGRFLLTGSANLLVMRDVADSLAGRAIYLRLSPFTGGEMRRSSGMPPWTELLTATNAEEAVDRVCSATPTHKDWRRQILTGGLPPAVLARSARARGQWFDGYITTYLERDLRDLSQVASLPDFRRLMGLAVHRVGQVLNQTDLGRDAGIPQPTAHRYLNLLETSLQIERLPGFLATSAKRLIKAPKLYWNDTGLAAYLASIESPRDLQASRLQGALLENLVLAGLRAWKDATFPHPHVSYWRTAGGVEVDFVIEHRSRLLPIEVKASRKARSDDWRNVETFLSEYGDRAKLGVVLQDVKEPKVLTKRIVALPLDRFL